MDRVTSDTVYANYRSSGCPNQDVGGERHILRYRFRSDNYTILKRVYCWDCDFEVVL